MLRALIILALLFFGVSNNVEAETNRLDRWSGPTMFDFFGGPPPTPAPHYHHNSYGNKNLNHHYRHPLPYKHGRRDDLQFFEDNRVRPSERHNQTHHKGYRHN